MKVRALGALVAFVAAMSLPASAVAAATIDNGSFEKDIPLSFMTLGTGSAVIDGWLVTSGSVDWIGTHWTPADGDKSVDMNGFGAGALSQSLATVADTTYLVTFYLAGNPDCAPATKSLNVNATGGPTSAYTFDTTGMSRAAMGWTAQSYQFTATGPATTLTFASTTAGPCGPALDHVTLAEVAPEDTDCRKGGWQTMLDGDGRPFKNQGDCVSYQATNGRNVAAQ